jgi:hypothetical protein
MSEEVKEQSKQIDEKIEYKLVNPVYKTELFNLFQKVIKSVQYPKDELTIKTMNRQQKELMFKFKFEWQDENICGIDMFQRI